MAPVERVLAPLLSHTYSDIDLMPTICTTDCAKRVTRAKEISALIGDLDATIDAVARLENKIVHLVLELKQRRVVAEMTLAPVTGLLTEVL